MDLGRDDKRGLSTRRPARVEEQIRLQPVDRARFDRCDGGVIEVQPTHGFGVGRANAGQRIRRVMALRQAFAVMPHHSAQIVQHCNNTTGSR
jgi:hypothetical protein